MQQSETNLAGETAYVFKTEYNGKPLYVISFNEEFNGELKVVQPEANLILKQGFKRSKWRYIKPLIPKKAYKLVESQYFM